MLLSIGTFITSVLINICTYTQAKPIPEHVFDNLRNIIRTHGYPHIYRGIIIDFGNNDNDDYKSSGISIPVTQTTHVTFHDVNPNK